MDTFTEVATKEYNWITETIASIWDEAFDANKIYDPEVVYLHDLAIGFHSQLRKDNGEFADDFFRTMESLKAVAGDLMRTVRGQKLPEHIQRLVEEERKAFGFAY